jgi:uncharacterized OsmC-like protein
MKYEKILVLGLAAVLSVNALAFGQQAETTYNQLAQQVHTLQQKEVIPKIDINYIIKSSEQINSDRVKAEALLNLSTENCTVNINVTPDMKISYSGSTENREALKEVTASSSQQEEQLRTSYITYHEASHCKMYEIKDVFKSENKNVEQILNKFFQFSSSSYDSPKGNAGIYYILHENFADTFAYIQMIKNHGVGKDVLTTLQKIQIERSEAANTYNKNGLIAHNTEFSLKEVLKEENIKKIMNTESQTELQELALKIANDGMWKSLKTHSESYQSINFETLENGATFLLSGLMFKLINNNTEKNINLQLEDNALYQAAVETKNEISQKFDLGAIKTEDQLKDFYVKNTDLIKDILVKKLEGKLDFSLKSGIDVLETLDLHFSHVSPGEKQSLEEIKISGRESLQDIQTISSNLSINSVLKNLESIRSTSFNNQNKVHLKYNS